MSLSNMCLSIYFPHNLDCIPDVGDHESVVSQFNNPSRKVVFFGESIFGLILYKNQNNDNSETKKLGVNLDISIHSGNVSIEKDIGDSKIDEEEEYNDEYTAEYFSITTLKLGEENIIYEHCDSQNTKYTIWKFEALVSYPRHKFDNPNLVISAFLNPNEKKSNAVVETIDQNDSEETLVDYVPGFSTNLFAELNSNTNINNNNNNNNEKKYHLSSSLFEKDKEPVKVEDIQSFNRNSVHVEVLKTSIMVPVSPSVVIRLESTKPAGRNDLLLATLNVEASENALNIVEEGKIYFNILSMNLDFKSGTIEKISCNEFPIRCRSTDSLNRTYKLTYNEFMQKDYTKQENMNYHLSKLLEIKLTLEVQTYNSVFNKYENISNTITTNWSPYLDFSIIAPPINNSLKATVSHSTQSQQASNIHINKSINPRKSALMNSIYRAKSPNPFNGTANSTVSLPNPMPMAGSQKKMSNQMGALSSSSVTVNLTTTNNSALSGLRLTFQGKINIKLGEIVTWKIQAINNSSNKLNLNLIVQSSSSYSPPYLASMAQSNTISASNLVQTNNSNSKDVLIYSKSQLLSLYNNLKVDMDGVIILDNNIKMGPLDPNTVYETNITLLGVSKGIFNLNGIKIFDTNSGDGLDFGKLVEVFVT